MSTEQPSTEQIFERIHSVWVYGFKSGIVSLLNDQGFPQDFCQDMAEAMIAATVGDPAVMEVIMADIRETMLGIKSDETKVVQSFAPLHYPDLP